MIPQIAYKTVRGGVRSSWLLGIVVSLAACGGATATSARTTVDLPSAVGSPVQSKAVGAPGSTDALGGHPAATYTCDDFAMADLLTAVQSVVPKATAGTTKTETSGKFAPLQCDYSFAPNLEPGLDPTLAANAGIEVVLDDKLDDGPQYSIIKQKFQAERDLVIGNVKGDASADVQSLEFPATGLGVESFFDDYITRTDGIDNGVRSDLSILRATRPVVIHVKLSYTTQPDSSVAAPAASDDPLQNESRHQILEAVAKVILAKVSA